MISPTAPAGIPVTVVGGYLGSGKTTRINCVLQQQQGLRLAVVVNDFGAVNVDADLLRSRVGDVLELANGCVCCSLADGMAAVMDRLLGLRPAPDHVLVEVSGVGNPATVARWGTLPGFSVGGVVVCVDAETVKRRAGDRWVGDTVRQQLQGADVFALTKLDLVSDRERMEVREWLGLVAPETPVVDGPDGPDALSALLLTPRAGVGSPTGGLGHHAEHRSWSISGTSPVDVDRILACLDRMSDNVVRGKGVLRTTAAPDRRTVVQLVGSRSEIRDDGAWRGRDESTLVLVATTNASLNVEVRALREVFAG